MADEYIPLVDPVASAEAGSSVPLSDAGSSMDFSSLFGSLFGMSGDNSTNMQELMNQYMQFVRDNTDYNNAWSAEQAQKQMDFQLMSQQQAQQYNAEEAAKNRNWQEFMSSTAHQREVADLKAAGLNPVLSASGGNGAAVTSGATASSQAMSGSKGDGDQSGNSAITGILGSALNVMTSLATKSIDAQTSLAVADKYTEMEKLIESMKEEYSAWEHQNYPSGMFQAISAVLHYFGLETDVGSGSSGSGFGIGSNIGKGVGSALGKIFGSSNSGKSIDLSGFLERNLKSVQDISDGIMKMERAIFGDYIDDGTRISITEYIKQFDKPIEVMQAIHNPEKYSDWWKNHKPPRSVFPDVAMYKRAYAIWEEANGSGSQFHGSGRHGNF